MHLSVPLCQTLLRKARKLYLPRFSVPKDGLLNLKVAREQQSVSFWCGGVRHTLNASVEFNSLMSIRVHFSSWNSLHDKDCIYYLTL